MVTKKQLELTFNKANKESDLAPLTPAVFHVLLALGDGPAHGYAVLQAAGRSGAPEQRMGTGTVYGTLKRLERSGHVRSSAAGGKGKRRFMLTPVGHRALWAESARLVRLARLVRDRGLGG